MYKIFRIDTGRIVKAGFSDEEEANDWLDQSSFENANYAIEEMDPDEEEQWAEHLAKSEEAGEDVDALEVDDEDDGLALNYLQEDDDEDPDENLVTEFDPDLDD